MIGLTVQSMTFTTTLVLRLFFVCFIIEIGGMSTVCMWRAMRPETYDLVTKGNNSGQIMTLG